MLNCPLVFVSSLTFGEQPEGEYGIIVSNPNNVDEKMVIVSAFAIDGGAAAKE